MYSGVSVYQPLYRPILRSELPVPVFPRRLSDACVVTSTEMQDADFWLLRVSGTVENCGRPQLNYEPHRIAIKVLRTDIIDPMYLYLVFDWLWRSGFWTVFAVGSVKYGIRVRDVASLRLSPGSPGSAEPDPKVVDSLISAFRSIVGK